MRIHRVTEYPWRRSLRRRLGRELPQSGSSLVEVIVATLILSIVSLGSVEVFANGHLWAGRSGDNQAATLLAQEAMEKTVAVPYAQISAWSDARVIGRTSFSIVVTVQSDVPETGVKTIQSTVSWQVMTGVNNSVTFSSMRHNG